MIDLNKLIIKDTKQKEKLKVNADYLQKLHNNNNYIVIIKRVFGRDRKKKINSIKDVLYIYKRNEDFIFIRNLSFRSQLFTKQANILINKLCLKLCEKSLKISIYK